MPLRTSVGPPGGHGRHPAAFHSHDTVKGRKKEALRRYCQQVDKALQTLLRDEQVPLLLACVDYLASIYREANSYPHLFPQPVSGNPRRCDQERLQREAWEMIAPYFATPGSRAAERYRRLAHSSQTSALLEQVLPAAESALVETLFVALDRQVWGSFEPTTNKVERYHSRQPAAEDLLDRAAVAAFLNGGTVYAVAGATVPDSSDLAAIFRFALN